MKKYLLAAAAAGALLASATGAFAEAVKLQLKWVTQAQFAGYYVAQAKGYYKDAGLDVTIMPGGPDINPEQVLAGGGADVVIDWMPSALATREKGSQGRQHRPALQEVRHDAHLPQGFRHQRRRPISRARPWASGSIGNEYPFLSWMSQLGLADNRRRRWRHRAEAGLQRRSAPAEAGRLHLDHDLQRVLSDPRSRHEARRSRGLQIRRPGRGHAGRRPLCAGRQAQGSGLRRPPWRSS